MESTTPQPNCTFRLTAREVEILSLYASGLRSKEIASQLNISSYTVESHKQNMITKSYARNVVELAVRAAKTGLL